MASEWDSTRTWRGPHHRHGGGRAGRGYDGRHGAGSEDEPMPVDLVKPSALLPARLGSNPMATDRAKAERAMGLPDSGREGGSSGGQAAGGGGTADGREAGKTNGSRLGTYSQILWGYLQICGSQLIVAI